MQGIESYLRELERYLDCPRHIRKPFLDKTRRMAEDFTQGRPEATRQEIADCLGEPQELAQDFLETLDRGILRDYRKRRKILLYGCIAVLIVAVVTMAAWAVYLWNAPMHVEISETLIIEQ